MAQWPKELDFWICFQSDLESSVFSSYSSELDIWSTVQSEFGWCHISSRPSTSNVQWQVPAALGSGEIAKQSSKLDFQQSFSRKSGTSLDVDRSSRAHVSGHFRKPSRRTASKKGDFGDALHHRFLQTLAMKFGTQSGFFLSWILLGSKNQLLLTGSLGQVVGQEKLHMGALRGNEWMDRFAGKHCSSREILDFPKDQSGKNVVARYRFKT